MYPEKLKVIAQQVQLQQQQEQVRLLHQEKLEREQQIRTQVSVRTPPRPTLAIAHPWGHPVASHPQLGAAGHMGGEIRGGRCVSVVCLAPPVP